jgi:hypothetical protein
MTGAAFDLNLKIMDYDVHKFDEEESPNSRKHIELIEVEEGDSNCVNNENLFDYFFVVGLPKIVKKLQSP